MRIMYKKDNNKSHNNKPVKISVLIINIIVLILVLLLLLLQADITAK